MHYFTTWRLNLRWRSVTQKETKTRSFCTHSEKISLFGCAFSVRFVSILKKLYMDSLGHSFLCSPHLDVWELLKQAAHAFLSRLKKFVCVKKIASCFGNSHTSECGLVRKERPIESCKMSATLIAHHKNTLSGACIGLASIYPFSFIPYEHNPITSSNAEWYSTSLAVTLFPFHGMGGRVWEAWEASMRRARSWLALMGMPFATGIDLKKLRNLKSLPCFTISETKASACLAFTLHSKNH